MRLIKCPNHQDLFSLSLNYQQVCDILRGSWEPSVGFLFHCRGVDVRLRPICADILDDRGMPIDEDDPSEMRPSVITPSSARRRPSGYTLGVQTGRTRRSVPDEDQMRRFQTWFDQDVRIVGPEDAEDR